MLASARAGTSTSGWLMAMGSRTPRSGCACCAKPEILQGHCEAVGRNYDDIIKSTSLDMLLLEDGADRGAAIEANRQGWSTERFSNQFLIGGVDKISERIQRLIDAGIEYVIVYIPRVGYDHTPMLRFAREVLPQFV